MSPNGQTLHRKAWFWNFGRRTCAGIPALGALLLLLLFAPWYATALMIVFFNLLGLHEYRTLLAATPEMALPFPALALGTLLIGAGAAFAGAPGLNAALGAAALMMIGIALWEARARPGNVLARAGLGLFGLLWIPWFTGHLILVQHLPQGQAWLIFLLLVITCNDTAAYLVGTALGRHPLLPGISPHKTVEGSLGGMAGALLGGLLALAWVLRDVGLAHPLPQVLLLSVALGVLGQAGDMTESLIKRATGVKDSGVFLPGHGGVLDRMDAFLLAPPVLYHYLVLTGH